MPLSRHNTTKRGTQKQRAKLHHEWLNENHPQITSQEFQRAMMLANMPKPAPAPVPHKRGDVVTFADGSRYQVSLSGAWKRQRKVA
jgi:hypothetical protein